MIALRSVLFFLWMYGLMTVMTLLWLPSFFLPRGVILQGTRWYTGLVRWGVRVIAGIKTEIRGLENLPQGPVIYAPKHQCMWDVLVVFLILEDPSIIMKQSLLWFPGFGWFALKNRMIPIDREGTLRTLKKMVAAAQERVGQGRQIVIFPEGTRYPPGAKTEYHAAGLSALYKALNLPVVPVATNAGLFWEGRGLLRKPGVAVYQILPPIEPGLKRKAMMERVKGAIDPASLALVEEAQDVQDRLVANQDTNEHGQEI